jgi:hypothetical protein
MNNLFVSYEISLKLKEKKFDKLCLAYYQHIKESIQNVSFIIGKRDKYTKIVEENGDVVFVSAPTYQQVVDWFREKHNLVLDVFQELETYEGLEFDEPQGDPYYTGFWEVDISKYKKYEETHIVEVKQVYKDYYEAWDKAITEALKLI